MMNIDTVVTLEDNNKYFLADQVINDNIKYFLANLLDENEEMTEKSMIFKETINEDGKSFLEEVNDQNLNNLLIAMFANSLIVH